MPLVSGRSNWISVNTNSISALTYSIRTSIYSFSVRSYWITPRTNTRSYFMRINRGINKRDMLNYFLFIFKVNKREQGRDMTRSYDKSPYINGNVKRAKWQHKNATKKSITQRLRTDEGRSVGVTIATQLVWLTTDPTFTLIATVVLSTRHTFQIV